MKNQVYGYIRVSSRDQNEERQKIAVLEYGVPENCIFLDRQSGKDFDRPGYKAAVVKLRPEDTFLFV